MHRRGRIHDHDIELPTSIPSFGNCFLTDVVLVTDELGDQAVERVSVRVDVVCRTRIIVIGARKRSGQPMRDSSSTELTDDLARTAFDPHEQTRRGATVATRRRAGGGSSPASSDCGHHGPAGKWNSCSTPIENIVPSNGKHLLSEHICRALGRMDSMP